jgi:PAS domain S-box-containing protein
MYDGVIIANQEGLITDINPRGTELLALSEVDTRHKPLSAAFPAITPDQWEKLKSLARREPFVVRSDRTTSATEMRIVLSRIDGTAGEHCLQFRPEVDLSDQDDTRLALEIKFLTLFEHSTDGLALFEKPDNPADRPRLMMCNDSYVRMAGRSREELMSCDLSTLIEPVKTKVRTDSGFDSEFELTYSWIRPDGEENYIASRTVPVELGDRHYVYSINHDITARRQIDEMFRREHCAVENAGTGIVILDPHFIITYANPAAVRMFGYEYCGELLGTAVVRLWHDPLTCQQLVQDVLDTGETYRTEAIMLRSDNTPLESEVSIACNFDSDGERAGLVLSFVDISDRKRAQMQKAMLASLGAACHHLGQPAQILMANLAMLKINYQGDTEIIETCEEAVDRIGELLRKFNTVTEYQTVPYAQGSRTSGGDEILKI